MSRLPECSVTSCTNLSDPRWYVYANGKPYPACDGCGGYRVEILTEPELEKLRASYKEGMVRVLQVVEAEQAELERMAEVSAKSGYQDIEKMYKSHVDTVQSLAYDIRNLIESKT